MLQVSPHPILKAPSPEQARDMGFDQFKELINKREQLIKLERENPYKYGYEPQIWKKARELLKQFGELLIMGGNRGSKTEFAAKEMVKTMVENPGAEIACFQADEGASIEMQQKVIWKYLPPEWKAAKPSKICNILYNPKTGFAGNRFVAPNGSICNFRYYTQGTDCMQGAEWGPYIGVWNDELVPIEFIKEQRFRVATRDAKILNTFTPIKGASPTVMEYLRGAKTLETSPAPWIFDLLGMHEDVPRVQMAGDGKDAAIIYFHSADNLYGNPASVKKKLIGQNRDEILCRAYGIPFKVAKVMFPRFGKHHIIPDARIPKEGTNYHIMDPAKGRNHFMLWIRVTASQHCYVYRESPCPDRYVEGVGFPGNWAEPSGQKLDGAPGSAQEYWGWGYNDYKREIEKLEVNEHVTFRYMDSRAAKDPIPGETENTTLLEQYENIGLYFDPTPGKNIDEGVEMINNYLSWDVSQTWGPENCADLYIAQSCKNLIFAMETWGDNDGQKSATKDPIDCLRYFVLTDPIFVQTGRGQIHEGGYV